MLWFLLLLVTATGLTPGGLLPITALLSDPLQEKCALLIPESLQHRALAQSFLCGVPLSDSIAKPLLLETGLLHLMVVSGSHLQMLTSFLLFCLPYQLQSQKIFVWILCLLLFAYSLATGFQPPVVRAFLSLLTSKFNFKYSWNWTSGKTQAFAGLLTLLLFPEWIQSLSFYLSWLASLGFLLSPLLRKAETKSWLKEFQLNFLNCAVVQTWMAVFFLQFSAPALFSNVLLAPLISLTLMPLSLLAVAFPAASNLTDQGWAVLLNVLSFCTQFIDNSPVSKSNFHLSPLRWIFLWSFLAFLHAFFECLHQHRYRKSYV